MIDLNSRSALADRINYLIDVPIDATAADSQRRGYLGASIVGHHCERHVQYHLLAARGEVARLQPAARIMRIFDRGNLYEEKARRWLKDAGFLFGIPPKGKEFEDFGGQFKGHVDGVITGWKRPGTFCPIELPALWENKCLGAKGWKKLKNEKLKDYSSTYYIQVQLYMHYTGLERCLFTAVNADTMELYHEIVQYSQVEAELARSRVLTVISASDHGAMVPRCSSTSTFYICKWCDFSSYCWGQP
jgi:hypothetical protein